MTASAPQRALVVGAHPDDAELFAGGTVAAWCAAGVHVELLVLTDGRLGSQDASVDPAALARTRAEECEAAARLLGVSGVRSGAFPDGSLRRHLDEAVDLVARTIREARPDVVVGHDPWRAYEPHPDHRAAGWATCDGYVAAREHHALAPPALPAHRAGELWLMGTTSPDHFVEIGATVKLEALSAHASQFGHVEGWRARVEAWNRDIGAERGYAAAEAFRRLVGEGHTAPPGAPI